MLGTVMEMPSHALVENSLWEFFFSQHGSGEIWGFI
jgi:hypothetical protein